MRISQNQSAKSISAYDEPVPLQHISHEVQQHDAQNGAKNAFGTQNPLDHVHSTTSTPLTTITPADFLENEDSVLEEQHSTDSCSEDDLDEFQTIRNPANEAHDYQQIPYGQSLASADVIKYSEQTLPVLQPKFQLLPPLPSKNNSYFNQTKESEIHLNGIGVVTEAETGAFGTSNHSTLRPNTLKPAFTSFENGVYNCNSLSRRSALGTSEAGWNAASYCSTLKQPPAFQRNCLIRNSSTQLQELIQNAQMNNQQALQNQHHVLATQMAYKNKNNDFCSGDVGRKNRKHLMVSKCRAIGIVGTTFLLGFLLGGILAMVAYASGWVKVECGVKSFQ